MGLSSGVRTRLKLLPAIVTPAKSEKAQLKRFVAFFVPLDVSNHFLLTENHLKIKHEKERRQFSKRHATNDPPGFDAVFKAHLYYVKKVGIKGRYRVMCCFPFSCNTPLHTTHTLTHNAHPYTQHTPLHTTHTLTHNTHPYTQHTPSSTTHTLTHNTHPYIQYTPLHTTHTLTLLGFVHVKQWKCSFSPRLRHSVEWQVSSLLNTGRAELIQHAGIYWYTKRRRRRCRR